MNTVCVDTAQGAVCQCLSGYMEGPKSQCISQYIGSISFRIMITDTSAISSTDMNECLTKMDNCNENAECSDSVGSFLCACSAGYAGDGVTCNGEF